MEQPYIPVLRSGMPYDEQQSVVGKAKATEKPNVFILEFPEDGMFMDFINAGELRCFEISAMINNLKEVDIVKWREKYGR